MEEITSFWVRGRENRDAVVNALLESGYQLKIDLDKESELMTGTPSYLISMVQPDFDGYSFEAVSELDTLIRHGEKEED
jgi:hypothetical protein